MRSSIALIGHGSITTRHSYAYDRLNESYDLPSVIEKKVVCGRDRQKLEEYADRFGWIESSTDWQNTVCRDDIDIVDICVPDHMHFEIAKKAIECGKHVICEKPLVTSQEEARLLADMAVSAGVFTATVFNIRYHPGVIMLKNLIDGGELGEILHISASFIMDWALDPVKAAVWRMNPEYSPLGVLGDLGSHLADLCRFIGQEFKEVSGICPENGNTAVFDASFTSGAVGGFEVSRVSGGRGSSGLVFEVHGRSGSAMYETAYPDWLSLQVGERYSANRKYERVKASPWSGGGEFALPDAFTLLMNDFVSSIINKKSIGPTFEDGYECCRVISAAIMSSKTKSIMIL